jgi:hypothetical protein
MKWVTRERPKIDRIACPWLVTRFIDREPEFLFVPGESVLATARRVGAIPFDVPGAELAHVGPRCSFDAFLRKYGLDDPALQRLAKIIRGADSGRLGLAPQSAGLLAVSRGLSRNYRNDQEVLRRGFVIYDALYSWAREQHGRPSWSRRAIALLDEWRERGRGRRHLQMLDDRLLQDIGVTRADAEWEMTKPFWKR